MIPNNVRSLFPGEVFADVADFDNSIRQLIPKYDEMLAAIAWCISPQAKRILELGAGTGELSLKLLQRCPSAKILALDYSPRMIQFASQKIDLAGYPERWQIVEMDFGDWANEQGAEVVGAGYDACVSSLAIHHLSNETKLKLFGCIRQSLNPGGVFWNVDPVLPAHPHLAEVYQEVRQDWTSRQGTTLEAVRDRVGKSDSYGYSSQDQLATLDAHLEMLDMVGFTGVAVPWKYFGLALFGGFA